MELKKIVTMEINIDTYNSNLVGGWATPLKNMNVNWDDEIPNIWEK